MSSRIKLLDCTLRDGGYVVDTVFGDDCIKGITQGLVDSHIDILELGYLSDEPRKQGSTTYSSVDELEPFLPSVKNQGTEYTLMIKVNSFNLENLPQSSNSLIDLIRVCFYKSDRYSAVEYIEKIIAKGYKVLIQPMDTISYTEDELTEFIKCCNKLNPEAFYIVDTYGSMYLSDLNKLYFIVDKYLDKNISIGLHSHNNLQMSFALAQNLVELSKNTRNVILDSSLYGIGRGAGNACTELLANYLNKFFEKNYNFDKLLELIEKYIYKFKDKSSWGYGIAYAVSGMCGVHVNNAGYLLDNYDLDEKDLVKILQQINSYTTKSYDFELLNQLALEYKKK